MRNLLFCMTIFSMIIASCKDHPSGESNDLTVNPFLQEWTTPFEVPPFDKIREVHYKPAIEEALKKHDLEIQAILDNKAQPDFKNTIEALEESGKLTIRIVNVFSAMTEAMTNDTMTELAKEIYPLLTRQADKITLNPQLFERVKKVYELKDEMNLNHEQLKLLDKTYKMFVRGGANLSPADKEKFKAINEELSGLSVEFGDHVLKETNKFELILSTEAELSGLPESVRAMGAADAKARSYPEGKYLFSIQRTSLYPFITYSKRRDLREKLYKAYIMKGDNNDELDNKKILSRMVVLRAQRAKLLGYASHAHYVLAENMAKTPENVFKLLDQIWEPALKVAKKERRMMQEMIYAEGHKFKLESWDWWYYAEKIRQSKYALNEEEIKPYFEVNNVVKGVFNVAKKLWGLQFKELKDIPVYHPDVKAYQVLDKNGEHIAVFYTDYYPRESKRGGAWMDNFSQQFKMGGKFFHPVVFNVGNFDKPTDARPALLSLDNVETLFHEFGHALHGMLSDCTYESLSGTATPSDFVEFPSQVIEHWAFHPESLKEYAFHYKTGKAIPDELVKKITSASKFNQGFNTVEFIAAAYLDMYYHTLSDPKDLDVKVFEEEIIRKTGLIPEIVFRYRSTYYSHIFSGEYSAGYYSYIWSEVLDADAFAAFEATGDIFNQELASRLRKHVLSRGGTEDAMDMYVKFRGKTPDIMAMLDKRGLR